MKNKKILGALAALCMGIILCVSSVFAVNYWYTINNAADTEQQVQMGRAITLELADADLADDATGLYPGGSVIFTDITVKAPDWDGIQDRLTNKTDNVTNIVLPTFDLVITGVDDGETGLADYFTATAALVSGAKDGAAITESGVDMVDDTVLISDLQAIAEGDTAFTISVTLNFADNCPKSFSEATLKFSLAIVVDAEFPAHTND